MDANLFLGQPRTSATFGGRFRGVFHFQGVEVPLLRPLHDLVEVPVRDVDDFAVDPT